MSTLTTEPTQTTPATTTGGAAGQGSPAPGQGVTATWRDSLPEDIRGNAALANFSNVENLAKSYIHAQSQIGKKGAILPTDKSTDEEWAGLYKSLGQPELDKFDVSIGDRQVNEQMLKDFKATAHKAGLLPKQAQQLYDWFSKSEDSSTAMKTQQKTAETATQIEGLKREWGDGFDKQVALARLGVKEVGGEEFQQYLEKSGLGNDVHIVKYMAKVGAILGEDKIRGQDTGSFGQTPSEIQSSIDGVMGNPKHPYFDRNHPGHKQALTQMEGYYKKLGR